MKLCIILFIISLNLSASEHSYINSKDFTNWPFKQSEYMLGCIVRNGKNLVFINDENNISYGINGHGRSLGKKLLSWKDGNTQLKKGLNQVSLQLYIEKGLAFCK